MFDSILERIYKFFGKKSEKRHNQHLKKLYKNEGLSIISQNCIGGLIYHQLGLEFKSPTINLYFELNDYLEFCKNLRYYLKCELKEFDKSINKPFPVGVLGDNKKCKRIKIYFMHYKSEDEAKLKWNNRRKRVNYNNIKLIFTDRDGNFEKLYEEFKQIKYPKLIYTSKKYSNDKDFYFSMDKSDRDSNQVTYLITAYYGLLGKRRYEKYKGLINFLNEEPREN